MTIPDSISKVLYLLFLTVLVGCEIFGDDTTALPGPCNYTPIVNEVPDEALLHGTWIYQYGTNPAWTDGCEKSFLSGGEVGTVKFLPNGLVEHYSNGVLQSSREYDRHLVPGCGYLYFTTVQDSLIWDSSPCDGGKFVYVRE